MTDAAATEELAPMAEETDIDIDLQIRENALEAALLIHGYLDEDANFGDAEATLQVVTSAQMVYDFLADAAYFDYSHLLNMEEPEGEGSPPSEDAIPVPMHH